MMAQVRTSIGALTTESRELRINRIQINRLRLIGVITFISLIEWAVICMGYYVDVPMWLMIADVVCVMFNVPLIWWLGSLWWEQRKREKEIRKQANRRIAI